MAHQKYKPVPRNWKNAFYEVIFEADTTAGKAFDIVLLITLIFSIVIVILDSVSSFQQRHSVFLWYGIIAVPTGIVTVELANVSRKKTVSSRLCPSCKKENHDIDARYCKHCGSKL